MTRSKQAASLELATAIGLIWGYIKTYNYEAAHTLAHGCEFLWPGNRPILLLKAYAAIELKLPLSQAMEEALCAVKSPEWANIVRRRAQSIPTA